MDVKTDAQCEPPPGWCVNDQGELVMQAEAESDDDKEIVDDLTKELASFLEEPEEEREAEEEEEEEEEENELFKADPDSPQNVQNVQPEKHNDPADQQNVPSTTHDDPAEQQNVPGMRADETSSSEQKATGPVLSCQPLADASASAADLPKKRRRTKGAE